MNIKNLKYELLSDKYKQYTLNSSLIKFALKIRYPFKTKWKNQEEYINYLTNTNVLNSNYIKRIIKIRESKVYNFFKNKFIVFLSLTNIKNYKFAFVIANHKKNSKSNLYKNSYINHYEDNINFNKYGFKTDIKPIAFYFPQYHCFKENDTFWGIGFTDWNNVKKAKPLYKNHYEPREIHDDFGYYNLEDINVIKKQVDLAKEHGIYGFCMYYYWFSGKRVMEKPLDAFLKYKDINFPFCLCWANENWTRTWDGLENEILIKQNYTKKDPVNFIKDIKKYLIDDRYIKIDNKPVIMIYNPFSIPDLKELIKIWRDTAKKENIGELYIIIKNTIVNYIDYSYSGCDAEYDFPPHNFPNPNFRYRIKSCGIFDYSRTISYLNYTNAYTDFKPLQQYYFGAMMGFDNSPRRKKDFSAFSNYNPEYFYKWLKMIIYETRKRIKNENRFIFINAWNEWAEGTYLEPEKKYGYTNINTLSKAIYDLPYDNNTLIITNDSKKIKSINKKIAIQFHIYEIDLLDEILMYLSNMPYKYDLFVSTDSNEKKKIIMNKLYGLNNVNKLNIQVYINQGRDIKPFIIQLANCYQDYDYIGHFHTKKSVTVSFGDEWRHYLYDNLLGDSNYIKSLFYLFENNKDIGIIYPPAFYKLEPDIALNRKKICKLLKLMDLKQIKKDEDYFSFPAGSMFWAKKEYLSYIFKVADKIKFEKEINQLDGTYAHAIERIFGLISYKTNFTIINTVNKIKNHR